MRGPQTDTSLRVGIDQADGDPEAIAAMLAALGLPALIVDQAAPAPPGPRLTAADIAAALLVTVGGLILPGLGWLAGTALLWVSPAWSRRTKVLGTALFPLCFLLTMVLIRPAGSTPPRDATSLPTTGSSLNVSVGGGLLAIVVAVLVPLGVAVVLLRSGDRNRRTDI